MNSIQMLGVQDSYVVVYPQGRSSCCLAKVRVTQLPIFKICLGVLQCCSRALNSNAGRVGSAESSYLLLRSDFHRGEVAYFAARNGSGTQLLNPRYPLSSWTKSGFAYSAATACRSSVVGWTTASTFGHSGES